MVFIAPFTIILLGYISLDVNNYEFTVFSTVIKI